MLQAFRRTILRRRDGDRAASSKSSSSSSSTTNSKEATRPRAQSYSHSQSHPFSDHRYLLRTRQTISEASSLCSEEVTVPSSPATPNHSPEDPSKPGVADLHSRVMQRRSRHDHLHAREAIYRQHAALDRSLIQTRTTMLPSSGFTPVTNPAPSSPSSGSSPSPSPSPTPASPSSATAYHGPRRCHSLHHRHRRAESSCSTTTLTS